MLKTREPEMADQVKHKTGEGLGEVIAKYPLSKGKRRVLKEYYLDVRTQDRIIYETPIKNWEVVNTEEERLGST